MFLCGAAAFFYEHLASGGSAARVDLLEQCVVEEGDVVTQGLMAEHFGLVSPRRGGQTQHLAHEGVVVGDVFHAIPVGVQAAAHDAQHEDLPQVQAGAARGFLPARILASSRARSSALSVGCIQTHCRPARSGRRIFSLGVTGRSGWCWKGWGLAGNR